MRRAYFVIGQNRLVTHFRSHTRIFLFYSKHFQNNTTTKKDCKNPVKGSYFLQEDKTETFNCSDLASESLPTVEFFYFDTLNNDRKYKIQNKNDSKYVIMENVLTINNISKY